MLMAGLFWGGSGTISRFAPAAALDQPLALAWTRLFFGGVMLGAAALAVRRRGVFLFKENPRLCRGFRKL